MRRTRMNTAPRYHSRFLPVAPLQSKMRNGMEEVVGSIPARLARRHGRHRGRPAAGAGGRLDRRAAARDDAGRSRRDRGRHRAHRRRKRPGAASAPRPAARRRLKRPPPGREVAKCMGAYIMEG